MPISLRPTSAQRDDLAKVCALGSEKLLRVAQIVDDAKPTIMPQKLQGLIAKEVGDEDAKLVERVLSGFVTGSRRSYVTIPIVLDRTAENLSIYWSPEQLKTWADCRPALEQLLSCKSFGLVAKALDLTIDFEKLYLTGRILTGARPVFDDSKQEIMGAIVTQILRLDYATHDGDEHALSIALDTADIERLKAACEQALQKATITRKMIEDKCGIEAVMLAEEVL